MKVGDLCRWHDSASKVFKTGIIIERWGPGDDGYDLDNLFMSKIPRFTYIVLWNSGKITECSAWQLFGAE